MGRDRGLSRSPSPGRRPSTPRRHAHRQRATRHAAARARSALGVGGTQDRFDLIVVDCRRHPHGGRREHRPWTRCSPTRRSTPPCSRRCSARPARHDLADNVIDKRKFVTKALLTKIGPNAPLIRNLNGTGNHFLLDGDGQHDVGERHLDVAFDEARDAQHPQAPPLEGTLTAGGNDPRWRRHRGARQRLRPQPPLELGHAEPLLRIRRRSGRTTSNGKVYVWHGSTWEELATIKSANPPGTVITSLESPERDERAGLDPARRSHRLGGRKCPRCSTCRAWRTSIDNGVTPRHMRLPNAHKLAMICRLRTASRGSRCRTNTNNLVTLHAANMPRHGHNPRTHRAGAANPTRHHQPSREPRAQRLRRRSRAQRERPWAPPQRHGLLRARRSGHRSDVGRPATRSTPSSTTATTPTRSRRWSGSLLRRPASRSARSGSDHWHYVDPSGEHDHTATVD